MKNTKAKEGTVRGSDGTPISYRMVGSGRTILCFNGIGVARWIWNPLEEYLGDRFKIVTWDYRGHGASGDPSRPSKISFSDLVNDAILLVEKLKIRDACFVGHSSGLHVALEVIRNRREIATALISCLGSPGKALESFMDSFIGKFIFDLGYIFTSLVPELSPWVERSLLANPMTYQIGAILRLTNPAIYGSKEINRYLSHISRVGLKTFANIITTERKSSAMDVVKRLTIPFLIIAAEEDKFVPLDVAEEMKMRAKSARLFVIKRATHAALFEQPDIFNILIEDFICNMSEKP